MIAPITLREIAELIGAPCESADNCRISGLASLSEAKAGEVAILTSDRYLDEFRNTNATAVIVSAKVDLLHNPSAAETTTSPIVLKVKDADLAAIAVLRLFAPERARPPLGIHPTAQIASTAVIGDAVRIGPNAVVCAGAKLGDRAILHNGVTIGEDTTVGNDCEFFPNVVIRERITIGHRVSINAGSVIGTDGFGFRWNGKAHEKVPQIGTVIIEDDVEIGACTCIDRAKFAATRIGRGTKIDNLVQIAHNSIIGEHCLIAGQAGVAGSAKVGRGVAIGGRAALKDHITVGDGAVIAGGAILYADQPSRTMFSGNPAGPHRRTMREQLTARRLPDMADQLKRLQKQVDELQKKLNG